MNQILHIRTVSLQSILPQRPTPVLSILFRANSPNMSAELEELSHRQGPEQKTLSFWRGRQAMFPTLTPIAQDLMAASSSQAYEERIIFCVRTAEPWQQKSHVKVAWNARLLETERKCTVAVMFQWLLSILTVNSWTGYL